MTSTSAHDRGLRRNLGLLCAFHGLQMSLFPMAVITLFWKFEIGMSLTEIMLLQGFFGFILALFEFPSGYLADRIGYRRSLVVASGFFVLAWTTYVFATSIPHAILAELAMGVGMSLVSGSDSAMLYESLLATDREPEFAKWSGRMNFFGQSCEGATALVAGALFAWWTRSVFVAQVIVWLIAGGVALAMVEPGRLKPQLGNNVAQVRAMVRHVFVENRPLTAVVFTTIVLGMSSFVPVWTIQLYATEAGLAKSWLGPIWATANFTVAIFALISPWAEATLGRRRLLMLLVALILVGYLGMGLTHAPWGVLFYFVLTAMRGLFGPALHHVENRLIPSSDRAGMLSLRSLVFRLSFLAIGPTVGLLMEKNGQHPILLGLGVAFTSLASLGLVWMIRHRVA